MKNFYILYISYYLFLECKNKNGNFTAFSSGNIELVYLYMKQIFCYQGVLYKELTFDSDIIEL